MKNGIPTSFLILLLCLFQTQICSCVLTETSKGKHEDKSVSRIAQQGGSPPHTAWFQGNNPTGIRQKNSISGDDLQQNAVLGIQKPRATQERSQSANNKPSYVLQYDNKSSEWRTAPQKQQGSNADENLILHGEHRIKAMKNLDDSESFDVNAGPEVIIKDDKQNKKVTTSDQPDSEIGIGLQFNYRF
ncbi:MAG: hypothetical protein K5657_03510 [Desulfovibrio sp.]|nr:hypothetical protein [Desulfovibrio sp.]